MIELANSQQLVLQHSKMKQLMNKMLVLFRYLLM